MPNRSPPQPRIDLFFDLSDDLLAVVTSAGTLVKVNPAWARSFGTSVSASVDTPLAELIHASDRARVSATLAGLFPGPGAARLECHVRGGDGATRLLAWSIATFAGDDLAYCVVKDVTRAAAAAARDDDASPGLSDPIYRQILDAIHDLVLVKGDKARIVWGNRAFRDYYGMTNEQLQGIIDAPFSEPDNTLQYIKDDAHVFETGLTLHIDAEPVVRHDGQVRVFQTVKSALRSDAGQIILTVGVSRDITERRLRDEELKLMDLAVSATSEGIWVADAVAADSPVVYANAALSRLSGYAREELLGTPLARLIARLTGEAEGGPLSRAIAGQRALTTELLGRRKDGSSFWMRLSLTPVSKDDGQIVSFIALMSDITLERERSIQERAMQDHLRLIESQRETISALSTPIIEVWEGVLTMPIIGLVDSVRAASMIESLLDAISRSQARFTIVDLTGVQVADASMANTLSMLVKAAGLLGSACLLSGISPAVSRAMVELGVDLGRLRTFNTLRAALVYVLEDVRRQRI